MSPDLKKFLEDNKKILGYTLVCLFFFLIHLYYNMAFSRPAVDENEVALFIISSSNFLETLTFDRFTQVVFYIGVLWPVIPLLEIVGWTPDGIRFLMSLFIALTGPVLFFVYKEAFNFRRALALTLFLFTTSYWITFFNQEMSLILFFMALSCYLTVRWFNRNENTTLYLLAFITGLGFYLKAIVLYPVASLLLGFLIAKRKDVLDRISLKTVSVAGLLFVLGALPFFIYSFNTGLWYTQDLMNHPSGEQNEGFLDHYGEGTVTGWRFNSACQIIHSNLESLCHTSGIRFGQFLFVTEPTLPSLNHGGSHGVDTLHLYYFLILLGTVAGLMHKEGKIYSYALLVALLMTLYTIYNFLHLHLIATIPLFPLVVGYLIEVLPGREFKDNIFLALMTIIFIFSMLHVHAASQSEADIPLSMNTFSDDTPEMVTQTEYENFLEHDIEGIVITNFQHAYLLANLDLELDEVFFLREDSQPLSFHSEKEIAGISRSSYLNLDEINNITTKSHDITLILIEDVCEEGSQHYKSSHCGYSTSKVFEALDIDVLKENKDLRPKMYSYTFAKID